MHGSPPDLLPTLSRLAVTQGRNLLRFCDAEEGGAPPGQAQPGGGAGPTAWERAASRCAALQLRAVAATSTDHEVQGIGGRGWAGWPQGGPP
jgi:hypothetical protein